MWADPREGDVSAVQASVWEMGRLAARPVEALLTRTAHCHAPTMPGVAPDSSPYKAQVLTAGAELREGLLGHQPQELQ